MVGNGFRYAGCGARRLRKFYNVIGRFYDWIYTDQIQGYRQTADYLIEHDIAPGDFVMDLGCGTGLLLDLAKGRAGRLLGVDISLGMLRQARSKLGRGPDLDYIVADCRALPLAVI